MDLGLNGKRAIVTGGSRGIGKQCALALAREGRDAEELLQALGQELPAGRIAEPEEVAKVVTFLASEACSYMFGTALYMDGGKRRATP